MASQLFPKKNAAFTLYAFLTQQANPLLFQANPTLAAGDVKVSTDGGAFGNITTLPVVTPASGVAVKVDLSAAEMNGDNIQVTFSDASGAQWCDLALNIQTADQQVNDLLGAISIAEVSGVPAAAASAQSMLGRIYAALRSGITATATKKQFKNDAGTVQWEKDITSDDTTYEESAGNAP